MGPVQRRLAAAALAVGFTATAAVAAETSRQTETYAPGAYTVDHTFGGRGGQDIQICHVGAEGGKVFSTYTQDVAMHYDQTTSDAIIDHAAGWTAADGKPANATAATACDAVTTDTLVARVQIQPDGTAVYQGPVPVSLSWVPIEGF